MIKPNLPVWVSGLVLQSLHRPANWFWMFTFLVSFVCWFFAFIWVSFLFWSGCVFLITLGKFTLACVFRMKAKTNPKTLKHGWSWDYNCHKLGLSSIRSKIKKSVVHPQTIHSDEAMTVTFVCCGLACICND